MGNFLTWFTGMTMIIKFCCGAILIYCLYCSFLFVMQRQMMFPRFLIEPSGLSPPADGRVESKWLHTRHGKVEVWLMPAVGSSASPAPAVIYAHGNAELIDYWADAYKPFNQLGVSVLLVEYPGYGRSEGAPSEGAITDVFVAAYDWLCQRKDIDPGRIVLFGRSIGGGAVCRLAAERPSAALVLMSTFTSARFFARYYLAPSFLMRDPFDNLALVKKYPHPILVLHGKRDEVVPYAHGVKIAGESPQATLITYNSGHNDCPPDWSVFWQDMGRFLVSAGILPSGHHAAP